MELEAPAVGPFVDWLASPVSFPSWAHFVSQLDRDELQCLRRMFDHDSGPLLPVWSEVWDALFVATADACGLRIGIARARDLLVNLTTFGVLRHNAHSTSATAPSFILADAFIATSKVIGNWFDLDGAAGTNERLAVLHELQVVSTNLSRFSNVAPSMNAASRSVARAQLMGQMTGARGRYPRFATLFEQLRLAHNRGCPQDARIDVLSEAATLRQSPRETHR